MIKVLFAASEVAPFAKTGGLADVAGSLPKALHDSGEVEASVIMPLYGHIDKIELEYVGYTTVDLGWRTQYVGLFKKFDRGVTYYFIDNEYYFKRSQHYGEGDDGERFGYFGLAILAILKMIKYKPDIIHLNDWHTGAVAALLDHKRKSDRFYEGIRTVYTIHNLKYQGVFPYEVMTEILNLPHEYCYDDKMGFHRQISFMKAGIVFSDKVTTVSPTYADEIKYSYFGEHLDGLLRSVEYKLCGIINGIDYDIFDPKNDRHLYRNFDVTTLDLKTENKLRIQERFKLPVRPDVPMIAMITRLADQKGLDLLERVMEEMLQLDIQFVVLGTGEARYENMFRHFQYWNPSKLSAHLYFNEDLAHKIYAASDLFLMPSNFEPSGLGQMIAHRYGSAPIVRSVGGLRDTVESYNKFTGEGDGFSFVNYNAHELLFTVKDAVQLFKENPEAFYYLRKYGMEKDHSWKKSSEKYIWLYRELVGWKG